MPNAANISANILTDSGIDLSTLLPSSSVSGTSGQVAYFNGTNSITSSPTFAFTPTSQLLVNNSVTAASAIARGINATPSLTAAANNDVLVGLDIAPTFTNGAFTGVSNFGLRVRDGNSTEAQITTTRTAVILGNNSASATNSVNTLVLALPTTNGGNLSIQSGITSGTGLTETPNLDFRNGNGQTFARISSAGASGNIGRLQIGVSQPSTSITGGAWFYAAANRASTQFLLGSDFTDNSRAVITAHWDGASALILKPNASTTTAPTFRVRNNTDAGDNFLVYGATGNVGINVTTDAGFRLDVNGTARVQGVTTISVGGSSSAVITLGNAVNNNDRIIDATGYVGNRAAYRFNNINGGTAEFGFNNFTYVHRLTGNFQGSATLLLNESSGTGAYSSAILQLDATTRGFLQPRVTTAQRDAILTPATGLSVYNTTTNTNDFYNGSSWVSQGSASGASGQVAYFSGTNALTSSATFAFTPTSQLLVNNSVTAASAIARGVNVTSSLTAAANNDVLVGLDINPTFTNGAFTGVTNWNLRTNGSARIGDQLQIFRNQQIGNIDLNLNNGQAGWQGGMYYRTESGGSNQRLTFYAGGAIGSTDRLSINSSSGNVLINTTTDAGFRLDVNGTARIGSSTNYASFTTSATANFLEQRFSSSYSALLFTANNSYPITASRETYVLQVAFNTKGFRFEAATGYGVMFINATGGGAADQYVNIGGNRNSQNNASAVLELESTIKGFLQTRMTTAQRDAISTPATGLSVYNTSTNTNDYYNGSAWLNVGQVLVPSNNTTGFSISGSSLTGSNAQSLVSLSQTWNTTGNPTAIKLDVTNTASGNNSYLLDLQVGGIPQFTVFKGGEIKTSSPAGGVAQTWKLGSVQAVTPTSPNRTIEVEVNGTTYYLHAKTTND